jgi:valyl-tRNA synthetase
MITALRAARAESGIDAADWLPALLWLPDGPARGAYASMEAAIGRLARIRPTLVAERAHLDADGAKALSVITTNGEARLMRSDADRDREISRLEKELRNAQSQLAAAEARLSDHSFVTRAPQNVVDHARNRAAELREQAAALEARMREV